MTEYWTREYKNYFRISKQEKEHIQECAVEKFIEQEYQRTGVRPTVVSLVCFCPKCRRICT